LADSPSPAPGGGRQCTKLQKKPWHPEQACGNRIQELHRSLARSSLLCLSLSLFSLLAVPADSRFPPKDRPSPERDRIAAQIRLPFKAWHGAHSGWINLSGGLYKFVDSVGWRSSTRVLSQIWLQVRWGSKKIWDSSSNLATCWNLFSKFGDFIYFFLIPNVMTWAHILFPLVPLTPFIFLARLWNTCQIQKTKKTLLTIHVWHKIILKRPCKKRKKKKLIFVETVENWTSNLWKFEKLNLKVLNHF